MVIYRIYSICGRFYVVSIQLSNTQVYVRELYDVYKNAWSEMSQQL